MPTITKVSVTVAALDGIAIELMCYCDRLQSQFLILVELTSHYSCRIGPFVNSLGNNFVAHGIDVTTGKEKGRERQESQTPLPQRWSYIKIFRQTHIR